AVWQRQWLQGTVLETQLDYWKGQLADLPTLDLPTDHPRLSTITFAGAICSFVLPIELKAALTALSRHHEVTLFMTLLAAFQVLLSRYSGQTDIVVGSPIANRTYAEVEPLIGFLVNPLVLRTNLRGNPSFREVLQRVREFCLVAYTRQDLPLQHVVAALYPVRDFSRYPMFKVLLILEHAVDDALAPV